MSTYYKVSVVVPGRRDLGGIRNMNQEPQVGDKITLGNDEYEIVDVGELMPPRGDFAYLHAVCKPAKK